MSAIDTSSHDVSLRRALIVSADPMGEALARIMKVGARMPFDIVAFVDQDGRTVGEVVGGVPVVGTLDRLSELIRCHAVTDVLLTTGLSSARIRQIIIACQGLDIRVSLLPSDELLLSKQVAINACEVSIDDLLRREPANLDNSQIHRWLEGRILMVTGSAGSIGSEICRQLLQFGPSRLVLVDRSENGQFILERQLRALGPDLPIDVRIADIADGGRMNRLFVEHSPDILFHAAAYKHVPLMETNPGEAVKNNVLATRGLADLSDQFGLQAFVLISTDKAVNPTSVMGTCKRVAELYVQSLAENSTCRFVTVRFGNVLDSAGSVVPIFREQIDRGGPVTITDARMTRFFMSIPEAAQLVIQAGAMGQGGEIFVLDMGEPVRILDLAHDMIRLAGLRVGHDIDIQFTGPRPGEKLFEEVHMHGEIHRPTWHPRIRGAMRASTLTVAEIAEGVERLGRIVDEPPTRIIAELQRLVTEYRPDFVAPSGLKLFLPENDDIGQPVAGHSRAA